jgi:hypothetical protein
MVREMELPEESLPYFQSTIKTTLEEGTATVITNRDLTPEAIQMVRDYHTSLGSSDSDIKTKLEGFSGMGVFLTKQIDRMFLILLNDSYGLSPDAIKEIKSHT